MDNNRYPYNSNPNSYNNFRGGYNLTQPYYNPSNQFEQNNKGGGNASPLQAYYNSSTLNHHQNDAKWDFPVPDNSNFSNFPHNLQEGDIIEFTDNGALYYAIFMGKVGSKPQVLYAKLDIPQEKRSPSFYEKYWKGYKETQVLTSASGLNPAGPLIKINQGPFDEIIQNRMTKKNNFEDDSSSVNSAEVIIDRAMFTMDNAKGSPRFQNSKDWVKWCRYGRDILTRDIHVPSRLNLAFGSGKY